MWPCRRARGSSCNNETTPFVTEALPPLLINVQSYRRSVVVVPHATCSTDRPFAFGSFAFARIVISRATASLSFLPPLSLLFHRSAHGNARIRLSLSLYIYMHTLQLASSPPPRSFLSPFFLQLVRPPRASRTFVRLVCPLAVPKERRSGRKEGEEDTIHRGHVPRTFTCRHNAANRSRGIVIQIVAYSTTMPTTVARKQSRPSSLRTPLTPRGWILRENVEKGRGNFWRRPMIGSRHRRLPLLLLLLRKRRSSIVPSRQILFFSPNVTADIYGEP